jgi:hypothetical protein
LSGPEDRSSSRTMKSEEVRKISPWRFCVAPMMDSQGLSLKRS